MDSQDPFDILGMQDTLESTETATERYLKIEFVDEGDELDQNIHYHGQNGLNFMHMGSQDLLIF
jgi:hypothetical protein